MKILKNIANNHFSIQCISESKLGWYCIRSHIRPKFLNKSFNRYQPCVATPASDAQMIVSNCGQFGHMFTFCSHWQISMAKVDKVPYSNGHTLKDKIRLLRTPLAYQNQIMGHRQSNEIADGYGEGDPLVYIQQQLQKASELTDWGLEAGARWALG